MAAEAALLAVPALFVSSLKVGRLSRLEHRYRLLENHSDYRNALTRAKEWLGDASTPQRWHRRRARLLDEMIDLVPWIVDQVESFG